MSKQDLILLAISYFQLICLCPDNENAILRPIHKYLTLADPGE